MNPSTITVYNTVLAANELINAADFDRTKHTKLDGTVDVSDSIDGRHHVTTIYFNSAPVAITDNATSGGAGYLEVFDFPEGLLNYNGGVANAHFVADTGLTATSAVVASLGTAPAAADATLTGTEADLIPSTSCTLSSRAADFKSVSTTALKATLDGTGTAKKAYLNIATVDAGITGAAVVTVTGSITLTWDDLGDK